MIDMSTHTTMASRESRGGPLRPASDDVVDDDAFMLAGVKFKSRFLVGTARYPSPEVLGRALDASGAQLVTVALKRMVELKLEDDKLSAGAGTGIDVSSGIGYVETIRRSVERTGARLLPNTAGCSTAYQAIEIAHMAREMYGTDWIKLEVIGDERTLAPDVHELLIAATRLVRDGFTVLPYCTDDLVSGRRLLDAGCAALMPWAAPIGSARGLVAPTALRTLRERLPDAVLIVDAGLGAPSHAAQALEMGYDAVLLNSAVAGASDPVAMARAFALAIDAGRLAYRAGLIAPRATAVASTPVGPVGLVGRVDAAVEAAR
jgi:thiazole synthase